MLNKSSGPWVLDSFADLVEWASSESLPPLGEFENFSGDQFMVLNAGINAEARAVAFSSLHLL
jgi:hypothetical protein